MTTLFSGSIPFSSGHFESQAFTPPQGFSTIDCTFDTDPFPTGETKVFILLSFDGGSTFPASGGGSWIAPHTFPPKFAHKWNVSFNLSGATVVKITTDAPAAFTTNVVILGN